MADITPTGERDSRRPSSRSPQAWIRRRARRLARAYNLTQREALKNAIIDWAHFQPGAPTTSADGGRRG